MACAVADALLRKTSIGEDAAEKFINRLLETYHLKFYPERFRTQPIESS
jgi:hypothetical protein